MKKIIIFLSSIFCLTSCIVSNESSSKTSKVTSSSNFEIRSLEEHDVYNLLKKYNSENGFYIKLECEDTQDGKYPFEAKVYQYKFFLKTKISGHEVEIYYDLSTGSPRIYNKNGDKYNRYSTAISINEVYTDVFSKAINTLTAFQEYNTTADTIKDELYLNLPCKKLSKKIVYQENNYKEIEWLVNEKDNLTLKGKMQHFTNGYIVLTEDYIVEEISYSTSIDLPTDFEEISFPTSLD